MKLFLKILFIVLWVSLAAGAIVLMGFANKNHEIKSCTGIEVIMDYVESEPMFTPADLKHELTDRFGKFEKKPLNQLDLEKVMAFLRKNPNIDYADAHLTIEGKLEIEVAQCKPIARLISFTGQNFYLDEKGKIIPVNPEYPVRVIVANGAIAVPVIAGQSIFPKDRKKALPAASSQTLYDIYSLARQMMADSILNALVEQIYIKPDGTIQLATKAGSHIVEFGDSSNSTEKFDNLKAFYKYGLSKTGWQKYRIINLTYKNQVVCTK